MTTEKPTRSTKVNKILEPLEQEIGQDGIATAEAAGREDEETILVKPRPEPVDSPEYKEKMANLQFMEDMVTVHIHDTAEKDADPRFEISVNGKAVIFHRGETRAVKRYIVEGLARAKPVHYRNEEYINSSGERSVRWPSSTGLRYGFSVIQDPHPRGGEWLKSVLRQP